MNLFKIFFYVAILAFNYGGFIASPLIGILIVILEVFVYLRFKRGIGVLRFSSSGNRSKGLLRKNHADETDSQIGTLILLELIRLEKESRSKTHHDKTGLRTSLRKTGRDLSIDTNPNTAFATKNVEGNQSDSFSAYSEEHKQIREMIVNYREMGAF